MDKRIRVGQIIYGFSIEGPGGGIGRFGIDLSKALDQDRFEVLLVGLWDRGSQAEVNRIEQLRAQGLQVFTGAAWDEAKPYKSFWKSYGKIRKVFAQEPPDIIHSHSEFGDIAALLLKVYLRSPSILRSVHYGYQFEWRKRPLRRILLTNLLYPLMFRQEIGVSRSITENLNRRRLSRGAICIPNAIDLERFRNQQVDPLEVKKELGLDPRACLVGTIGRLTEQKGFRYFIEAIPSVLQVLPDTQFLVIGEGELEVELKDQCQRSGILPKVVFTGPRTDVERLLPCLDLFVSSSLWEGLPTVILESMAAGVPVVGTSIPGTIELIQDQVTGWLGSPGDSKGLAAAILRGLGDASARNEVRMQAQKVVDKFSIQSIAAEHELLYSKIVARGLR